MPSSVRYFFLSFVILFAITINIMGSYVRANFMSHNLQEIAPASSSFAKEVYEKYLWSGYGDYLSSFFTSPYSLWSSDPNLKTFNDYASAIQKGGSLFKVELKTPQNQVFSQTNGDVVVENDFSLLDKICINFMTELSYSDSQMIERSSKGLNSSRIINTIIKQGATERKAILLKTSGSIGNEKNLAIIEVYYDITKSWKYMHAIQIGVTVVILMVTSIIFVILALTSNKAQKIINKQIEVNLELEDAKKKAEELSNQKSMFLANMSHELRTPLNSIIGFSDIIRNESLGPVGNEQYKEYGNDIHSSGTHLLSLINDILDFSKADADKLQVEQVDVDFIKMIKQCIRIIKPKADEAKINIIDNTGEKHYLISADPKRLKQVFLNIMSNSIKFTPENGELKVNLIANDNEKSLKIQFIDTGIGIAAKDIAKVMQPFVQVENSLSKKHAGTGLGIPLTKKLVELMHGKFEITSEVGLGTTVTLSFKFLSIAE